MKLAITFLLLVLVCSTQAAAFGVVMPPLGTNNSIEIREGTTPDFVFGIQNVNSDDLLVKISLGSENDIAKLTTEEIILVPAGSVNHPVPIKLVPPPDAKIGDIYPISFTAIPADLADGGQIQFKIGISKKVNALIVRNPDRFYLGDVLSRNKLAIPIIAIIILLYVWMRMHEGKKKQKKARRRK